MSRWRESLCGKLIQASKANNQEIQSWVASHQSEVLSCGGKYLSRVADEAQVQMKPRLPSAIMLPKENYELIVDDPGEGFLRYGLEEDQEQEAQEQEISDLMGEEI